MMQDTRLLLISAFLQSDRSGPLPSSRCSPAIVGGVSGSVGRSPRVWSAADAITRPCLVCCPRWRLWGGVAPITPERYVSDEGNPSSLFSNIHRG